MFSSEDCHYQLYSALHVRMPKPPGYAGLCNCYVNKTQALIAGIYILIIRISGWHEQKCVYPWMIILVRHTVYN